MKAYHNQPELKAMMVEEAIKHREQDRLQQGTYGKTDGEGRWHGCAVACTLRTVNLRLGTNLRTDDHRAYEAQLGIPEVLARLEDRIFENLTPEAAQTWPERFLSAIPVGADLSQVVDRWLLWLLVDETEGVVRFAKTKDAATAVRNVAALFAKKLAGEKVTTEEWQKARIAAYASYAYASASYAYAYASDADDAASAAYAAASYAADDAADVAARQKARQETRKRQAEKLCELLAAAPVAA